MVDPLPGLAPAPIRIVAPSPPDAGDDTDRNAPDGQHDDGDLHGSSESSRDLQETVGHPEGPHTDRLVEATPGAGASTILVDSRDEDNRPRDTDEGAEYPVRDVGHQREHSPRSDPNTL